MAAVAVAPVSVRAVVGLANVAEDPGGTDVPEVLGFDHVVAAVGHSFAVDVVSRILPSRKSCCRCCSSPRMRPSGRISCTLPCGARTGSP